MNDIPFPIKKGEPYQYVLGKRSFYGKISRSRVTC